MANARSGAASAPEIDEADMGGLTTPYGVGIWVNQRLQAWFERDEVPEAGNRSALSLPRRGCISVADIDPV
jgi:hypothetical protein